MRALAFSPDGRTLAVGSLGTRLRDRTYAGVGPLRANVDRQPVGDREGPRLWDLATGREHRFPA